MAQKQLGKQADIARSRARQFKRLRSGYLNLIFLPRPLQDNRQLQALDDIASSFSRFAAYQQTAFDNGAPRSGNSGEATSMQRLVDRAITQVLGRATGRGANGFISALNSAFPTINTGEGPQVVFSPSRSLVSLYRSDGSSNGVYASGAGSYGNGTYPGTNPTTSDSAGNGYAGMVSARQANLYRQVSIIAGDALRVLDGLTPFVPEAEQDQVGALRSLIRSDINSLVDEFGRVDEPRKQRVSAYFSALDLHIADFGESAFFNAQETTTISDESQVAGFELLKDYCNTLRSTWKMFAQADTSPASFSLSLRVERANILLPAIAQANVSFEAALDSVGFTEGERRSQASKFSKLRRSDVPAQKQSYNSKLGSLLVSGNIKAIIDASLPDITVYDLTEWVDRFANLEAPSILADSGVYGLDFVTDQADQLFWVVAPIVARIDQARSNPPASSLALEQNLLNERVRFALNDMLDQLDSLADLSVRGGDENTP